MLKDIFARKRSVQSFIVPLILSFFCRYMIEIAAAAGIPFTPDPNVMREDEVGVDVVDCTMKTRC